GVVLFAVWGGIYLRNTSLFAFVALPFLAAALSQEKKLFLHLKPWRTAFIWVLCLSPFVAVDKDFFTKSLPDEMVNWSLYPVRAFDFVDQKKVDGRMYNSFSFGGYLSWRGGPERKIFMDGRYIFYPLLVESENLKNGKYFRVSKEAWQLFFNKYH